MPGRLAARAKAPNVRPTSSRAIKNRAITVIRKRRYGNAKSDYKETVRLQQRHRWRRTRIEPSNATSTNKPCAVRGRGLHTAGMIGTITIRIENLIEILLERPKEGV